MVFPQFLNNPDTSLFLVINGNHSGFFDAFFTLFTSMITWIPFYVLILYLVFKKYNQYGFWVLIAIIIAIVLSDQIAGLIKNTVQRYRPSNEPLLTGKVHIPVGPGGAYGFISSHAANTFAFAFFMGYLTKNRNLFLMLFGWACVTAYSRIYVGVHYPLDVFTGAVLGSIIGWLIYKLLMYCDARFQRKKIFYAGKWKNNDLQPAFLAMLFIIATFLMVAPIMTKYFT
jgi:undecaprenyl-diphosphatase